MSMAWVLEHPILAAPITAIVGAFIYGFIRAAAVDVREWLRCRYGR